MLIPYGRLVLLPNVAPEYMFIFRLQAQSFITTSPGQSATIPLSTRMKRDLAALADQPFDALVIGGGIFGAGVARDAALRGLRVALIDKADFASGTSSRSSKL